MVGIHIMNCIFNSYKISVTHFFFLKQECGAEITQNGSQWHWVFSDGLPHFKCFVSQCKKR